MESSSGRQQVDCASNAVAPESSSTVASKPIAVGAAAYAGPRVACPSASTTLEHDEDAFFYQLCASHPPPTVDLSRSWAQRLVTYPLPNAVFAFMCSKFPLFAMVLRLGVAGFITLLLLPKGVGRDVLSVAMPFFTISVSTTMLLLSTDIVGLLAQNYEFWFVTVINTLNWSVLSVVLNDIRGLGCLMSWFAYQSVITVDANHRTYATAISSAIASIPVLVAVGVFVAVECVEDANYFAVHLHGRKVVDASDMITFTLSTLVLFFIKIFVGRRTRRHRVLQGVTYIPCTTLKLTLCLVPAREVPSSDRVGTRDSSQIRASRRQQLTLSNLALERVDLRRTLIPYRFWKDPPHWIKRNATGIRVVFYTVGLVAYVTITIGTLRGLYLIWTQGKVGVDTNNGATSVTDAHFFDSVVLVLMMVSSVTTVCFCGGFMLFYQKDLLRSVVKSFDFVFSMFQLTVFHVCMCDANYWKPDHVAISILWLIWFFWTLTLDALTPLVTYRVFRFQKRFAALVHASIVFATAATGIFILLMPTLGLRDRVIWSYTFSSTTTFSARSLTLLLGRSVTIALWCSRQAYLIFTHRDDELTLIRGSVEYFTPFPLISSALRRTSTRRVVMVPRSPSPRHVAPSTYTKQ